MNRTPDTPANTTPNDTSGASEVPSHTLGEATPTEPTQHPAEVPSHTLGEATPTEPTQHPAEVPSHTLGEATPTEPTQHPAASRGLSESSARSLEVSSDDVIVEVSNLRPADLDLPPTAMDWEEVSSEASDAINNVVSNIMERMRVERMFELRRLQHGDRAVSSGETRDQLEELFSQPDPGERRVPRTEGVRDELEQLSRNRSVGNLLNTRFRTLLESSLSVPRGPAPRSTTRAPVAPPPPPAESTGVRLEREASRASAQVQQLEAESEYEPPDYTDRQFEYAITDVEELFQRRLVSDVLHSAFRNVLELHIERRIVRSGGRPARQRTHRTSTGQSSAGQPSPEQPLPGQPSPRQPSVAQPSAAQSSFVSSASRHFPDIAASSTARRLPEMERKLHVMSTEMKEMKAMLKLLVDTQVDIQRSIRQEVNALIRNSNVVPARPTPQIKEGSCVVCLELPCDTVIYRCGHLCCCYDCARQLRVAGHHCPVCRAEVTDILRIYKSTNY